MMQLIRDPAYALLKEFLIEFTGLAYYADKDDDLAGRVERRMEKLRVRGCAAYLDLLRQGRTGEAELDALIAELTIGETYFFRHGELFDALRDSVLPDLIERNRHTRRLRIWSAGCAAGPEPYSVAILLRRELGRRVAGWEVSILGTDINREFLARAREGRFDDWALRSVPDDLKRSCFTRCGDAWVIAPEYREGVSFQYHNLVKHPFPSLLNNLAAFDLILCRNVTIYFSQETIRRTAERFHECLVDGGWLAVGHAEPNAEVFGLFRAVNLPGAVFYQKRPGEGIAPFPADAWTPPSLPPVLDATGASALPAPEGWPFSRPFGPSAAGPKGDEGPPSPLTLEDVRRLADRGAYEQAVEGCEALLEKERLNPRFHFYRALALEQVGRHAETEQALRRAIYLDRGFVLAHYHLGLFLQRRGDGRGAGRSFENALRLLSRMDPARPFEDGDGIRVAELKALTEMHLEVLRSP